MTITPATNFVIVGDHFLFYHDQNIFIKNYFKILQTIKLLFGKLHI